MIYLILAIMIMFCKGDCYIPLDLPTPLIIKMTHNCTSMSRRVVTCFHTDGRDQVGFLCYVLQYYNVIYNCISTNVGIPRKIDFPSCTCESDCVKLIQLHYWPATSSKPDCFYVPLSWLARSSVARMSSGCTRYDTGYLLPDQTK